MEHLIADIRDSNKLVIVEGKKDRIALEGFGITNIIELNKTPIFAVIENVVKITSECVILTDLDKQGKKLYNVLNCNLQRHGIKVDDSFRLFLFKNTKLRNIEGLRRYFNHHFDQKACKF